jgi:Flp pilus assembly protein TadB
VVKAAGGAAGSRLVVLSEGETIPYPTLTLAFPADVITWYHDVDDNTAALHELAAASGGRIVAPADAAALASAFPGSRPPAGAGNPGTSPAAPGRPAGSSPSHGRWSWELFAMLAGVFVALLFIGLLLTGALGREDPGRRLEAQLDRHYSPQHGAQPADGEGKVASAAVGWVARLLGSSGEQRLAWRLDLAGIGRKPAEWVVLGCSGSLLLAVLLTVLTSSPLVGVLAGALVGWLGMRLIVSVRITRRRAAFADQLPDVLQLVAGSLQSGFSLPQALDAVVREDTQPAAAEFSRALAETRISGELEVAMDRIADRMDSTDLRWTVMAIRIQREVGGNLVEVLRNTVDTMRERAQLRRQVRALSAEGRLSAYILVALPVLVGAYLFLTKRSYIRPLYTTSFGLVMLIGAAVLVGLGSLWMRKVVKVEV